MLCFWLWAGLQDVGAAQGEARKAIDFLPQWAPQAQFAGFYVADAKGFYERRGLAVNVLRGGPERPAGEQLAAGQVDFGTLFLTEGIALRDQGVPLVNVGQLVQRSALMLVAFKDSGIRAPEDIHGRRVSVWDAFRHQSLTFFRRNRLDVTIVPQGYTLNLFLMGGVDVASAMWYNEYFTILNSGIDADQMSTFLLADYGLNVPEDGIYCRMETLRQDPEMARAFVLASIEGWRYAFDHPEEALDIVMARVSAANLPTNRVHQRWMLDRMEDIIRPADSHVPMGTLTETDFLFVAEHLRESGIIQTIPSYLEFHAPTLSTP
jgi:NitT/TauT family transport system substrate-binding protein